MMSCCGKHGREVGLWLGLVSFVIGAVILLQMFEVIPDTTWDFLWPIILVVIGLKLMICSAESCGHGGECCPGCGMCGEGNCVCGMDMTESKPAAKKKKATKRKSTKKKK